MRKPRVGHRLHLAVLGTVLGFAPVLAAQSVPPIAWLIFVDDLHLDFRATGEHRAVVRRLMSLARPGELLGIHSSGPTYLVMDPTVDSASIRDAIKRVAGNGLKPSDFVTDPDYESEHRANLALGAAHRAVATLARTNAARKILLYVSNGYVDFERVRATTDRPELTYDARRSEIVIYTVDPRAFAGPLTRDPKVDDTAWQAFLDETRTSLRAIADETGGFAVLDADLEEALEKINVAV